MSCLSRLDWTQCSLFFMSILTQPGMKQDSLLDLFHCPELKHVLRALQETLTLSPQMCTHMC